MRFRFPLQKVMDHRKTLENIAQRDFQEAQAELSRRQQQLDSMTNELHEARLQAGRVQTNRMSGQPETLKQIHQFTVLQDVRIGQQAAKVAEQEKLVEEKREILRQKAVDYKIIERLREKQLEAHLQEERVREQKEIDEIAVLRYETEDSG